MKQNAKSDKPFTLNAHVLERVNSGNLWFQVEKNVYVFTVKCENVKLLAKGVLTSIAFASSDTVGFPRGLIFLM